MRTLYLTVKKAAFDVMSSGEKKIEYRKPTKWIQSRLFDKKGKPKQYDVVEFRNGYNSESPCFIAEFLGVKQADIPHQKNYSNGLVVNVEGGDYMIFLGEITFNNKKI